MVLCEYDAGPAVFNDLEVMNKMRGLLNHNIAAFESENDYGFPEIFPVTERVSCEHWIDFDTARRTLKPGAKRPPANGTTGIHFYISDYKFNGCWDYPNRYIDLFKRADYVIGTDFSLYYDFPAALQIFNKYRNHWLSAYYSVHGISMIPNITVSTPNCHEWSFCGYPKKSVVAFSDIGSMSDPELRSIIYSAYDNMILRLDPIQILYFTRSSLEYAPSEADIIQLPFIKGGEIDG